MVLSLRLREGMSASAGEWCKLYWAREQYMRV